MVSVLSLAVVLRSDLILSVYGALTGAVFIIIDVLYQLFSFLSLDRAWFELNLVG